MGLWTQGLGVTAAKSLEMYVYASERFVFRVPGVMDQRLGALWINDYRFSG